MRRLAVFVVALIGCLALLLAPTASAGTAFSGGSGTAEDPFLLSTAADLRLMRSLFATSEAFAAYRPCFRLTCNIRLNQGLNETFMWRPIPRFTGELDGDGHTITGMYVPVDNAVPLLDGTAAGNGLIGELSEGSRVHALTLSGCVEAPEGEALSLAGGIACVNQGEIADCVSYVTVTLTRAVHSLQVSGVSAAGEGALLGCTDESRFYIYPEVKGSTAKVQFSGLSAVKAVRDAALRNGCVDSSKAMGREYPTVWNLYEPTPTPVQTPSPVPTPSPSPSPTRSPVPSLTPSPSPIPTRTPTPLPTVITPSPYAATSAPARTVDSQAATAAPTSTSAPEDTQSAVSAVGSQLSGSLPVESDYQYSVNPDGRSVEVVRYLGSATTLAVPDMIAGLTVTRIGSAAFAHNSRLLELVLPDKVTSLAGDALIDCPNLRRLHLPAALRHVSMDVVRGCDRLLDIDMPSAAVSVTGRFPLESPNVVAWTAGNAVAAVYCAAHGLTVRNGSFAAADTTAVSGLSICFRPGDANALRALYPGELGRVAGEGENIDCQYTGLSWSDQYFAHPSAQYDHELARMSLALSLAAASSSDGSNGGAARSQNVERALLDIGFTDIQTNGYANENQGGAVCAIAAKKVVLQGGETLLVAVVIGDGIRGEDWQTSLNLCHTDPSSPTHNGYADTAEAIYLRLQAYLHDARTPGSALKLWVTGFGSGGAIGNLLAARCVEASLPDTECFGYLFANPSVTAQKPDMQPYAGLFSIIDADDPVASLPPTAWGYGRYGQTLALPTQQSADEQTFQQAFSAMQATAVQIVTPVGAEGAVLPFLRMKAGDDRMLVNANRFMLKVMTFAMPTPATYDTAYFRSLLALWLERESQAENEARALRMFINAPLLQLAQQQPNLSLTGALDTCYRLDALAALREEAVALTGTPDAETRYPTVVSVLRGEASEGATLSFAEINTFLTPALGETIDLLTSMHSPELYLSWMMSGATEMLKPLQP